MTQDASQNQPAPLLSKFGTTLRNELQTWIAHVVIYAAYFSCVFFLLDSLIGYDRLLLVFFFFISTIPVLLQLATWNYWNMGFKSRTRQFFVSILICFTYFLINYRIELNIFWMVAFLNLIAFIVRRLFARKKHMPDTLTIALTVGIALIGYIGFTYYQNVTVFLSSALIRWQIALAVIAISVFSITPLLQTFGRIKKLIVLGPLDRSQRIDIFLRNIIIHGIFNLFLFAIILVSKSQFLSSLITFSMFLLSTDIGLSISRQKAHLANFLIILGINNITTIVSSDPNPIGLAKVQLERITRFVDQNRRYVLILFIFLIGGGLTPYFAYQYGLADKGIELFYVGSLSSFTLSLMYLTVWFFRNRKKHIVFPFSVAEGQVEPQLQSLANLMTYAFVQQLRYIALLLSMKQVENIVSRNDNTLPIFVTSGQEKELIEQIRSLGDIEVANSKIPFGGMLSLIGNYLAHTRVHGTVVRQKDNSIAILVEFVQKGGQVLAVDMDFVPETSAADLDEKIVNAIAKSLAVKLIIKLGNHPHLASSWGSMLNFVNGLDAAYHRNWWQAISFYRKSIHDEESTSGPTGPAYYHLGASLVSQGNIIEGYSYLKVAEAKNAPLGEVQYMIALAQYYMFHDFLHVERAMFEDIKWRCSLAIKDRPYFPEAHHLLGTVYYQRGKLLERSFTKTPREAEEQYSKIEILPQDYVSDYKFAIQELSKAIKGYDRTLRLLPSDIVAKGTVFDERAKLIQYRMSAAHRCGDALRSLERYSEADLYYQETLLAYPVNIRTLVDRAKTYCFSGNWQRADEFIRYNIFNNEDNRSNKSANFYMGWALSGGLADEFSLSSRFTKVFVTPYEALSKRRRIDQLHTEEQKWGEVGRKDKINEYNILFGKSMLYLDYSIHQYPRYLHRWRQVNWYEDFHQVAMALCSFSKYAPVDFHYKYYWMPLDIHKEYYAGQVYFWLCWRVASRLPKNDLYIDKTIRHELGWDSSKDLLRCVPEPDFYKLFRLFVLFRERFEKLLELGDKEGVVCNLKLRRQKLELGRKMMDYWGEASTLIERKLVNLISQDEPKLTFSCRWAVDIFAEYAMLSCHVLAEAEAFEIVERIGIKSIAILKSWIDLWNKMMAKGDYFSPKVLDYQLASIMSWTGYSQYMKSQDFATKNRIVFIGSVDKEENDVLEEAQSTISEAIKTVSNSPLAIFVNALILKKKGNKSKAADELNRLLSQISPFDPHVYSRRNSYIENYKVPGRKMEKLYSGDFHRGLIYGERSCGDMQFSNVISVTQIHIHLAEIACKLEDYRTGIGHMVMAFSDTPYLDEQAEILISISEIFNRQGQYASALAVLEEANIRRKYLSPVNLPNARSLQVLVMECILKTNMENYRDSLERGIEISNNWGNEDLSRGHAVIIDYFSETVKAKHQIVKKALLLYKKRILTLFMNIERDAKFDGIVSRKQKMLMLLRALKDNTVLKILNDASTEGKSIFEANPLVSQVDGADLDYVFSSQILTEMYKDVIIFIVQQCEWMNNCAFNYCELGFNLDKAEVYAETAIQLLEKLIDNVDIPAEAPLWKERLAQFYDTLGWVYYRKGQSKDLNAAYNMLSYKALKCEQEAPLIYYHLARVRLAQIEQIWRDIPPSYRSQVNSYDKKAAEISKYLREAFLYWRHAHRLDKEKDLYARLRLVRIRIDEYRKNWEALMLPMDVKK